MRSLRLIVGICIVLVATYATAVDLTIPNGTGAQVRAAINSALATLQGQISGLTPTNTVTTTQVSSTDTTVGADGRIHVYNGYTTGKMQLPKTGPNQWVRVLNVSGHKIAFNPYTSSEKFRLVDGTFTTPGNPMRSAGANSEFVSIASYSPGEWAIMHQNGTWADAGSAAPPQTAFSFAPYSSRIVTWQGKVGVTGGIPVVNTINVTLSPNGLDDTTAINNAITTANSYATSHANAIQVVKLTAGTYYTTAPIVMKPYVILRGMGMGITRIVGKSTHTGTSMLGMTASGWSGSAYDIASGATKGSTSITLTSAPTGWGIGKIIITDQLNDANADPPVTNVGNAIGGTACTWCGRTTSTRSSGQFNRITSVNGATIGLETPLYQNYTPGRSPQAVLHGTLNTNVGVENLTLDNEVSGKTSQYATVTWNSALESWMSGVEVIGSWWVGLKQDGGAYRSTIVNCKFRDPIASDTAKFDGHTYGVQLTNGISAMLYEGNEFTNLGANIVLAGATSGNVFAYNYMHDNGNPASAPLGWNKQSIFAHGAHNSYNLFEGNYNTGGRIASDFYWGTTSHNTFFRNKSSLQPGRAGAIWDIDLGSKTRYYNLIGNVFGTVGVETYYQYTTQTIVDGVKAVYRIGYEQDNDGNPAGNDSGVLPSLLIHGNWDGYHNGTIWKEGDGHLLPTSLYLTAKPAWMAVDTKWPPIGPDVTPMFPTANTNLTPF